MLTVSDMLFCLCIVFVRCTGWSECWYGHDLHVSLSCSGVPQQAAGCCQEAPRWRRESTWRSRKKKGRGMYGKIWDVHCSPVLLVPGTCIIHVLALVCCPFVTKFDPLQIVTLHTYISFFLSLCYGCCCCSNLALVMCRGHFDFCSLSAAQQPQFFGTPVTCEAFYKWKAKFEAETQGSQTSKADPAKKRPTG